MGETKRGHVASVPDSPRRNPWLVWLAEVMLRPTLWPYALGLLRSGGGMPWAGWEAKRCGPPLFYPTKFIMTCSYLVLKPVLKLAGL